MMTSREIREFVLKTGTSMPAIGVGTFGMKTAEEIEVVLDTAFACGYRLIDTASVYRNEHLIGECLPKLLNKHNLKREDIFITTKLSPKDLDEDLAVRAFEKSLDNLRVDYVDLYLIHWPGRKGKKVDDPMNEQFRRKAWMSLEKICAEGKKMRHLGVSNYTVKHLEQMKDYADMTPAILQSELHPDYLNAPVVDYCKENNIHYQAYSSLGQGSLVRDERFNKLMTQFENKSVAQVLLRWGLQQGCSVLPKSTKPSHIRENFDINDFELSAADLLLIQQLAHSNKKYAWDSIHVA